MARIAVTYKGHGFIAVADSAGLDIEAESEDTMGLASELWHAIYTTRMKLFKNYEDYDTTPAELTTCLRAMKLIK